MTAANDAEAYRSAVGALSFGRKLRYTLFAPTGLHKPIFEVAASLKVGGFEAVADCVLVYPGPYEFGVVCAAKLEDPLSHVGDVRVVGVFRTIDGKEVARIERAANRNDCPWWAGPERCGFGLAIFAVPGDVPLGRRMRCEVQIFDPEGALAFYEPTFVYSRCIYCK